MIEASQLTPKQIDSAPFGIENVEGTVYSLLRQGINRTILERPNRISRDEAEAILKRNESLVLTLGNDRVLVPRVSRILESLFANAISIDTSTVLELAPVNTTTRRESTEGVPYSNIERMRNKYRAERLKQLGPVLKLIRSKFSKDFEAFFDPN